ncbi:hypothetical protein D0Z07_0389 [Hyphodiscus hymeniophilus]|uniref:Coenzyme Q-binding protein COQ10 START domain-containing protein n=1 Tax=Hyphodiscus hymeniophilus TaxID=353542 RepID=A0A9P6VS69_9HELO|nr:hypothetical protein D0Z07_0389 [Hyphodiscus hymeniophilus]
MPIYAPTTTSLTPQTPVTSSLVPAIPVPTHGTGGSFSVLAKTSIAAPPLLVLEAVRNTSAWPRWNSFCPRCVVDLATSPSAEAGRLAGGRDGAEKRGGARRGEKGWLEVGMSVTIEVFMNGDGLIEGRKKSRDQTIVITKMEELRPVDGGATGYVIAWKSTGFSHWQLHSERVMEFVEREGATEYVCWETFGGLLGSVVKATVGGQLVDRFGDYARDLKAFVEGGGGAGDGGVDGAGNAVHKNNMS